MHKFKLFHCVSPKFEFVKFAARQPLLLEPSPDTHHSDKAHAELILSTTNEAIGLVAFFLCFKATARTGISRQSQAVSLQVKKGG